MSQKSSTEQKQTKRQCAWRKVQKKKQASAKSIDRWKMKQTWEHECSKLLVACSYDHKCRSFLGKKSTKYTKTAIYHNINNSIMARSATAPPWPKIYPAKKLCSCQKNVFQKYNTWQRWKSPILRKLVDIKIISTQNFPCQKFATSCPDTF